MLVVSTNYEYALVSTCFGALKSGICPQNQLKYGVWSRDMDYPPARVMQQMRVTSESLLCVNFTDFKENEQGHWYFVAY